MKLKEKGKYNPTSSMVKYITNRGHKMHVNRLNFDVYIRETVILMAENNCIRSFDIDILKGTLIIKTNTITFTGLHIIKLKLSKKKITIVKRMIDMSKEAKIVRELSKRYS
jgi:hypothetical protein